MDKPLNILVIEDCRADFMLLERHLKQHGLVVDCLCIAGLEELQSALGKGGWDIVLSDYNVPGLNFLECLNLIRESMPDVPVVMVSGTVGEEKAIELLKQGVWDFVLKDSLTRLVPAIERGLKEAESRVQIKCSEEALRQSEERYRGIIESQQDLIVRTDPAGRYTFVNDAYCRIFGVKREDIIGNGTFHSFAHSDDISATFEAMKALERPPYRVSVEQRTYAVDGERWIAWEGYAIRNSRGTLVEIQASGRDITERKQAEEEVRKLNAELEQRVIARTAELIFANEELESFSYSVSHDLKAPLRAIEGYSRMIVKRCGSTFDEDVTRMFNVIRSSAAKMNLLIDDLLSFSRVVRNSMSPSEIEMDKLANEVWDDIRTGNQEREIELKITKLLPGFGDRTLIRQVLFNLISNSVKFTKNRKPGIIEVSSYSDNGNVVYCIKDNGVGFDMAYYDKLFGVFQRLHAHEEYEGTGVGLAIVQRIIHRNGGRVWAEGEVDKGATFFFALPTQQE